MSYFVILPTWPSRYIDRDFKQKYLKRKTVVLLIIIKLKTLKHQGKKVQELIEEPMYAFV